MNITVEDIRHLDQAASYNFNALSSSTIKGISTDSRTVKPGELFFAIRGDKLDGHNYVTNALSAGAVCAVVDERADRRQYPEAPLVVVRNTTSALGGLANIYRRKFDIPVIAVAGSNGKTTTKEMITSVLGKKYSVLCTQGNLNNQIGVPQTIFRLKPNHEIAVIEIGTNHFGELKCLCNVLQPTCGLITNIGREHLEFFKNLKGVSRAEGELFRYLAQSGIGFVNVDDGYIVEQGKILKKKTSYGFTKPRCTIRGKYLGVDKNGWVKFEVSAKSKKKFAVQLSMPGKHAMQNALAAAAVGLSFGVSQKDIQHALKNFAPVGKRMERIDVGKVIILNDTYNANPDSVLSALETIQGMECKGKKIVVLADMLELGTASKKEHERIGKTIGSMGFEYLLTFGENARNIYEKADVKMKVHYDQKNILSEFAVELISDNDIILVKGSRGMKMEDVTTFLVERLGHKAG